MKKTRIAAIDIGTNSIRCIIAEATTDGSFKILDDEKATVCLGEQLAMTGVISDDASRSSDSTCRSLRLQSARTGVDCTNRVNSGR